MKRYRRLVTIDRVIPFLAAFVGLIALAGAVTAQLSAEARTQAVTAEIAALRSTIEQFGKDTALASPTEDGTAEGLLALQDRMNRLEADWAAQEDRAALLPAAPAALAAPEQAAAVDPNLPTTDCIPLGTRFMVTPNETYPLCQSRQQIKVGLITGETVDIEGAGSVVETGFGTLAGSSCTVMVFSADPAGFAELRVTCGG
jgi:hypothetical protein